MQYSKIGAIGLETDKSDAVRYLNVCAVSEDWQQQGYRLSFGNYGVEIETGIVFPLKYLCPFKANSAINLPISSLETGA